jgi:hypothetical protein
LDSLQRYIILMLLVTSLFETSCRQSRRSISVPDPRPTVTSLTPSVLTISEGRQAYMYATTDRSLTVSAEGIHHSSRSKVSMQASPNLTRYQRGGTNRKPGIDLVLGGVPLQTDVMIWKSSSPDIAGVVRNGSNGANIFTYSPGTAIITAGVGTYYDGSTPRDTLSATVTVVPATARSMVLTLDNLRARLHETFEEKHLVRDTLTVEAGKFVMLYPIIRDSVGVTLQRSGISWASSDITVAEILGRPDVDWLPEHLSGSTTEIHVKKPGVVTVSASFEHLTASAHIKANPPEPIP